MLSYQSGTTQSQALAVTCTSAEALPCLNGNSNRCDTKASKNWTISTYIDKTSVWYPSVIFKQLISMVSANQNNQVTIMMWNGEVITIYAPLAIMNAVAL